jgi:hypothetical protein
MVIILEIDVAMAINKHKCFRSGDSFYDLKICKCNITLYPPEMMHSLLRNKSIEEQEEELMKIYNHYKKQKPTSDWQSNISIPGNFE